MKRHLPARLLLVGACSAMPVVHAADNLTLPATQIDSTSEMVDGVSQGYEGRASSSTTKLGLTDKQTPQGVTTITRQALDDFKITGIKDALRAAPSVTVEQTETDRTEFTSRGFDINTFEYDGTGMPFVSSTLVGDQDLAEYEQIDVLHGANGLMSGAGNPSATVNFVRKRPTDTFQAQVDTSVGSWDSRRIDVDVAGPLTDSGNVRGRFIYSHDKGNSWMDRYSHERNVAAGLLAFDVSDADTVTVASPSTTVIPTAAPGATCHWWTTTAMPSTTAGAATASASRGPTGICTPSGPSSSLSMISAMTGTPRSRPPGSRKSRTPTCFMSVASPVMLPTRMPTTPAARPTSCWARPRCKARSACSVASTS